MTSSSATGGQYVKQVDGVGFSLAGKVSKRERARIEALVEEYIRRNYDAIRAQFASTAQLGDTAGVGAETTRSGVRLCINRTSNEVSIVSVSGGGAGSGSGGVTGTCSGSGGGGKCQRRPRKKPTTSATDSSKDKPAAVASSATRAVVATGAGANVTTTTTAAEPSDDANTVGGHGGSMEAAIEYLMSRSGGQLSVENRGTRLLRSGIPKRRTRTDSITDASNSQALNPLSETQPEQQQQLQLPKLAGSGHHLTDDLTTLKSQKPLVGDTFDCLTRGAEFSALFPKLRGEFYVFYDHGEAHCRKILTSMGFTERHEDEANEKNRSVDDMAVLWCNGAIAAIKRQKGMGYHIVNRLRFRGLVTNKCSLVRTLCEFELHHPDLVPKGLEASSFLPASIHLNGAGAIDVFHKIRMRGMYLIKPGFSDCGKGIVLYRSDGSLTSLIDVLCASYPNYTQRDLVLQRYIENPLLLLGKKFDLRVFLLVVPNQRKEAGVYAFVHPGYVRLACRNYDINSDDLTIHLTNQAIQHKDRTYRTVKEDTVWSPDTLNQYLNQHRAELNVPCQDWVVRRLYPRVRAVLSHLVSIVSSSLCDEPLSFELFGCDFLVDDQFNVWLLEVNSDPSLNKSTRVLRQIITQVVEEAVGLSVEVLQRTLRGMPIKSLVMEQDFRKVFSHANETVQRCVLGESRVRYPQHFVR